MSGRVVALSSVGSAEDAERLARALVELHPYELPELVALEITDGHEAYLEWLDASVQLQD
jgi:periplasmic divalent cation tolerance protein